MFVALVMIAQQLGGTAVRDGFFLTHFEASSLPSAITAASLLSVAIVLFSARLFRRFEPARVVPVFFAFSAALFVVEWALSTRVPRIAAASLYLHTTSFGAVVISGFWSIISERFDPLTAKQVIGRIAGGATLGGVLGGFAAWRGAAVLSIPNMILTLAFVNLLCAIGLRAIGRPNHRSPVGSEDAISVLEIFQETPYLRQMALLVGLAAFADALYDYVFKSHVVEHFGGGAELVSFFALFYLILGLATFAVQNLFARQSLKWLGLALTVGMLPGAIVVFGLAALLVPGLAPARPRRGGTPGVETTRQPPGDQRLYTPLLPEKKRPTKTLVDVGGDKLGTAIGGGVAFFVIGIVPSLATPLLLSIGVGAGALAIVVTRRLHQGYVASLAESLRRGTIDLSDPMDFDATTRQTVSETLVEMQRSSVLEGVGISASSVDGVDLSREELLERLQARRAAVRADAEDARHEPFVSTARGPVAVSEVDEVLSAIADLRSGDRSRIDEVLRRHNPLPPILVPHLLPLFEKAELTPGLCEALSRVAPAHVGLLLDVLLRVRTPLPVRRALCEILGGVATKRSAHGLLALLNDSQFELRFSAVAGLLAMSRSHSSLEPPKDALFAAAEVEARYCERLWRARTELEGLLTQQEAIDSRDGRRVVHGLSFIFTTLLIALDRDALQLAIRALADTDAAHRGTGLEYLDNVLPVGLKRSLWPLLQEGSLARATLRAPAEILQEIIGQEPASEVDLAELRERIDAKRRERAESG